MAAAVRLAIAELLAADHDGTLPIVFDDAFAYSDPQRVRALQRMLDLGASRGLQVIVLTCNPADYAGWALGELAGSGCWQAAQVDRDVSIDTIVFDMDGVIIDTEEVWSNVRHDFAVAHGGHWTREIDQPKVMGANSMQWAASMRENNGVDLSVEEIYRGIVAELRRRFALHLEVMPGAPEAIAQLARAYQLGVASSSPLELIEYALQLAGVREHFKAVISSDDVAAGKPEPQVYLEACRRLGTAPARAAAVEDSSNGLKAAHAAGLTVIAIPHPAFPPSAEALELADLRLHSITELTAAAIERLR